MKIALVNPNQYQKPPVIPMAIEYLATHLWESGHEVSVLDLCFSENVENDVRRFFRREKYDIIGITIRNVDTTVYFNNQFFLKEYNEIISIIKKYASSPIILGGQGFSSMPMEILNYLGGDIGVMGPGEGALLKILKDLEQGLVNYRLINGWEYGFEELPHTRRGELIDYDMYLKNGGILGIELQKGCPRKCEYCLEREKPYRAKNISLCIEELSCLVKKGYNHFHICDSEFNIRYSYCVNFCKRLIKEKLPLKWACYMKLDLFNEDLIKLMSEAKCYLITLNVDTLEDREKNFAVIRKINEYSKKYNIKLAIDFLFGFPGDSLPQVETYIQLFREIRPKVVGLNFYIRLFKHLPLTSSILQNEGKNRIVSPEPYETDFFHPTFYNRFHLDCIKRLTCDDPLFRFEGFEKNVNYQRVQAG